MIDPAAPTRKRQGVSQQIVNVILCVLLACVLFGYIRKRIFFFPITLESLWQISLAETNRRKSKRRVQKLKAEFVPLDVEKGPLSPAEYARCMASVVGYREEPGLFTKCLQSYKDCPGLEIMLVGIDGNEAQDMEMANIVQKVFPSQTVRIGLEEPLANLAIQLAKDYVTRELEDSEQVELPKDWTFDDFPSELRQSATTYAMQTVYRKAAEILQKHDLIYNTSNTSRVICIYQPHVSKKGIMFTNLIFSTILSHLNHIDFLWTSDSDTWITPETIPLTIGCMVSDSTIGGSCSTLGIHNGNDSLVSRLGSAIYWAELAITRGQTGAIDAVDCQPGPCAAFRLSALSPNLFDWYTQTSMGIKTIVNEDRHLTTKLLLNGWKVTFNTEAIAYTDTPTTLLRWLLQQIRWARANQIETFQYPSVYAIHGPILFLTAINRFYGPLSVMVITIRYVLFGTTPRAYSITDILLRVILCTVYNYSTNINNIDIDTTTTTITTNDKSNHNQTHNHTTTKKRSGKYQSIKFLALSQIFYQLPLPGIIVYATFTALESGWGTSMRNNSESRKARGAGWDHLGSVGAICVWMGFVAAALVRLLLTGYGFGYGVFSDGYGVGYGVGFVMGLSGLGVGGWLGWGLLKV